LKQDFKRAPEQSLDAQQQARMKIQPRVARGGAFFFLLFLCVIIALGAREILRGWPLPVTSASSHATTGATTQSTGPSQSGAPVQSPNGQSLAHLQLPGGYTVVYELQQHIYTLSTSSTTPHVLNTPGYTYNRAVSPVVTAQQQVIYSGSGGIWMTDLSNGQATQLAKISADQIITSMVVSNNGSMLAWSSAPLNGDGTISIYAGSLDHTTQIYQQSATKCPCFRAYAFASDSASTLLLSDDRGDHRSVWYGLWTLNLTAHPTQQPQSLLADLSQQGPLALDPQQNTLLYSDYLGYVPTPAIDEPANISSLTYANSLSLASIQGVPGHLAASQVVLPAQSDLGNTAAYHWIATPTFSPGGQTLAYVNFSVTSNGTVFPRHSSFYTVAMNGQKPVPVLLATTSANYVELGGWLNDHILTFYADNALYALDVQNRTATTIVTTGAYAHIFAVVKQVK
jgi:hypothetical protein